MSRRKNSLRRRRATRNPKPKSIIVCEGRLTEPDYFYSLAKSCGALVSLEVILERGAGVPMSVVDKAISLLAQSRRATSFSRYDTAWAVFDRDQHPDFDEAINKALASMVNVGFSNPCFELWLVLHCQDWDRPMDRHAMQKELRRLLPSYDPNGAKRVDFHLVAQHVSAAVERGRVMEKRRIEERSPRGNPVTTVFHLVEHVLKSGKAKGASGRAPK